MTLHYVFKEKKEMYPSMHVSRRITTRLDHCATFTTNRFLLIMKTMMFNLSYIGDTITMMSVFGSNHTVVTMGALLARDATNTTDRGCDLDCTCFYIRR